MTFCQKPLSASSDLLEFVDDQSVEGSEREDRQEPEGWDLVFMLGAGEGRCQNVLADFAR